MIAPAGRLYEKCIKLLAGQYNRQLNRRAADGWIGSVGLLGCEADPRTPDFPQARMCSSPGLTA